MPAPFLFLRYLLSEASWLVDTISGVLLAGFLPFTLCSPSFLRQVQDVRLFGWHGPEGQLFCVVEAALVVADIDSGIVLAGFAGFVLCFPSLSSGRILCGMDQKDRHAGRCFSL